MSYRLESVSLEKTGLFSKLFLDYVNRESSLLNFCHDFPSTNAILEQAERYSIPFKNRKTLYQALQFQYEGFSISQRLEKNLQLLEHENTYTVCTGHQLCLFTGPSYFIYKIISCIQLCEELNANERSKNFVPVYWMASEDHDIEEINHANVFGKKIDWITRGSGKAGKLKVDGISEAIHQLEEVLGKNPFAHNIIQKLKSFLENSFTLSDFTRRIVDDLFGKYGLVILDPDDKKLKELFIPQLEIELFGEGSSKSVISSSEEMKEMDYYAQVNSRDINLFFIGENFRERIVADNHNFKAHNTTINWTKDQLKSAIYNETENFSPNVILRPLYQQLVLPNVAYVGGPAEISYWLQLKKLFLSRQISFPFLIPRRFISVIEKKYLEAWHSFGFVLEDIFNPQDSIINKYLSTLPSDFDLKKHWKQMEYIFDAIKSSTRQFDDGFHTFLNAERQKVINSFSNIENKINRFNRQKNEVSINKIKSVRNKILPNNALQERSVNFYSFISNYGFEFTDQIIRLTSEKSLTEKNDLFFLVI